MFIKTHRTHIRPFLLSDLEDLQKLCSNTEAMRYIPPHFSPETKSETRKRIKHYIAHEQEYGLSFGYVADKSGHFMGRAGFYFVPEVNLYEIGYSLLPQYWNKGLATEITQGLLEYSFETIKLDKLCGRTVLGNHKSDNVLLKAGFNFLGERVFEISGQTYLWNYYECENENLLQSDNQPNKYKLALTNADWDSLF